MVILFLLLFFVSAVFEAQSFLVMNHKKTGYIRALRLMSEFSSLDKQFPSLDRPLLFAEPILSLR